MSNIKNNLIDIIKSETIPAIGCTEPIAVAFASAVASDYFDGKLHSLKINTSKGFFKNAKFVKIPNTNLYGLDLASVIGFLYGDSNKGLLLLEDITEDHYIEASKLLDKEIITVDYLNKSPDIYVEVIAENDLEQVKVVLKDSHNHIESVEKNNKIIFQNKLSKKDSNSNFIKNLRFSEIIKIIETINIEDIRFIQEGIDMNMKAANEGLKNKFGLEIGYTLQELVDEGKLSNDASTQSRILTSAATDVRMAGHDCPIMTSAGSGNQGLCAIIPIVIVAQDQNIHNDTLLRAVFFAHIINKYVKLYTGKLSFLCGCAISAGIGSSAAISWMLNGTEEQIKGAANNMLANLTGMICDGAKESCSFKLGTSSSESVISAYLANHNIITNEGVGIIGDTIEESIKNIGELSNVGYPHMDSAIIKFME